MPFRIMLAASGISTDLRHNMLDDRVPSVPADAPENPSLATRAAVAHRIRSTSAHVQLRLLNISGPHYALASFDSLRISLNLGPSFSAETFGAFGRGAISCKRNGLLITPPDLELAHRATTSQPGRVGLRPARLAVFVISRELMANCMIELGLRSGDVALAYRGIDPNDVLLPLAQSLLADLMSESPDGWRATEGLARTLVTRILLRLRTRSLPESRQDAIATVCRHIESRLHEPLAVQTLAEVAGISQYHFCRVFQQAMGKSPHQYVMASRIDAACRLLWEATFGDGSAKQSMLEIALACGFGSSSHFSTQFRKHTGQSPLAWRSTRRAAPITSLRSP